MVKDKKYKIFLRLDNVYVGAIQKCPTNKLCNFKQKSPARPYTWSESNQSLYNSSLPKYLKNTSMKAISGNDDSA